MNHPTGSAAPTTQALAILQLPGMGHLAPEQIRGARCVWCATRLTGETAIDLGARSGSLAGIVSRWFPRACKACTLKVALAAHETHPRTCEQCVDDPYECTERRALRRLALELRR